MKFTLLPLTLALLAGSPIPAGSAPLPLALKKHERIALVGNSTGERMNLFGHFETLLESRFPELELVVRNFCRPADEVGIRQRPNDYTKIDDPLKVFGPETFFCFFGFNESFGGSEGAEKFGRDYEKFLDEYAARYGSDRQPRFVIISPIALEAGAGAFLPEASHQNANLKSYVEAARTIANKRGFPFVDLFAPTLAAFNAEAGAQFTINGCHVNEAGEKLMGELLDRALFGTTNLAKIGSPAYEKLRAAVNDKSWVHHQDYRILNGWYVYGGRRTWDTETFPREFQKVRAMAALRDRYIWDLAQGAPSPQPPDDKKSGDLLVPPTRFGNPQQSYSEHPGALRYLSPEDSIRAMAVPEGFEVKAFASEREFSELAKPVQLNFDNKGRLWVACMPTYPQWRPGDPRPSDRLLIFEDTNSDGTADACKVFYDQLHCPTGFEFWNGGVLVVDQPRLIWLKDTDGDDKADQVVHLIDGWASDDTHHTIGAFEWNHGGLLHALEGVSMSTAIETPWGPQRNQGSPGAWVIDPRSWKVRHFVTPGYGNPWCYVFNWWGQGVVGDGTTAQQHWDTPLSGAQYSGRRGLNVIFNNEGMRPVVGTEFLYSRHLPDDVQGQFIYACVINMNGLTRFEVHDEGGGYGGKRIPDLLKSSDKHFRPTDPQIGPDGAVWFGDWANALIGHMQYSQRDPNRDHAHGRIFRLSAKNRPLIEAPKQAGKSVLELLDQLKQYEPRTRYRARTELRDRPTDEVLAAIKTWASKLDAQDKEHDRLLCEAMWVQEGHHALDLELVKKILACPTPDARAAAVHTLSDERDYVRDTFALIKPMAADAHPRVRVEAVRALSFFSTKEAVEAALETTKHSMDYWVEYTLDATLGALQPVWKPLVEKQQPIAGANPAGTRYLLDYLAQSGPAGAAIKPMRQLLDTNTPDPQKKSLMKEIAKMKGNAENGRVVFSRICIACHKLGDQGIEFGPPIHDVGARLKPEELVESIVEPNAKLDPKFQTTNVETSEGQALSGFVVAEDPATVTLRIAGGLNMPLKKSELKKRETVAVSSMPEGLANAISAPEFVDLIAFLKQAKGK
ncbi:MAG: DUF7133 domain-containing protein [Verrucomicrobiales bacterium]